MKSKITNYIITGILTQGLIFLLWIILPYYHKTEIIGEYNILLFYLDFMSALVIVGGDSVILRYYYSDYKKEEIFSNVFWTYIFFYSIIIIIFSILLNYSIISINSINLKIIILLLITILFNALVNLILIHYIAERKDKTYRNIQIIKTLIFFILSLSFSYFSFGIVGLLFANILSLFVVVVFHFNTLHISSFKYASRSVQTIVLKYGIPLTVYSLMGVYTIYVTRILVNIHLSIALVGIFGFYNIISNQINGLWSSFNKAWTPEVFEKLKKNDSIDFIYESIYLVMFLYITLIIIGVIIGNSFLFDILFRSEYLKYINVFIVLIFYPFFTSIYTLLYPLFYFNNNTKKIMYLSVFVSLFSLSVSWFLIKYFGLIGASISVVISSLFNLILYLFFFRHQINFSINFIKTLFFIIILLSISIFVLIYLKYTFAFLLILFSISIFLFYTKNLYSVINKLLFKLK